MLKYSTVLFPYVLLINIYYLQEDTTKLIKSYRYTSVPRHIQHTLISLTPKLPNEKTIQTAINLIKMMGAGVFIRVSIAG